LFLLAREHGRQGQGGGSALVRDDDVVRPEQALDVAQKHGRALLRGDVVRLRVAEAEEVRERDGDGRLACARVSVGVRARPAGMRAPQPGIATGMMIVFPNLTGSAP
jgi:hypothetical protein